MSYLSRENTLFLDIDGVFNSHTSFAALGNGSRIFNPASVRLLEKLIVDARPVVVWSTSWRGEEFGQEGFDGEWNRRILQALVATPLSSPGDWWEVLAEPYATPSHTDGYRGREILEWITKYRRDPKKAVIVDDCGDMEPLMERLVQTDFTNGFNVQDYKKARDLFGLPQ